jgi:hypothetical protein
MNRRRVGEDRGSKFPGYNTEVRRWSTYQQGESRRGEGK